MQSGFVSQESVDMRELATYDIVTDEIHVAADFLPTETTQHTVCERGKGIEELECSVERQNLHGQLRDIRIAGKGPGKVLPQNDKKKHVENTNDQSDVEGNASRHFSRLHKGCADQVGDSGRGCDTHGKRNLEGDGADGAENALSCQMGSRDV